MNVYHYYVYKYYFAGPMMSIQAEIRENPPGHHDDKDKLLPNMQPLITEATLFFFKKITFVRANSINKTETRCRKGKSKIDFKMRTYFSGVH